LKQNNHCNPKRKKACAEFRKYMLFWKYKLKKSSVHALIMEKKIYSLSKGNDKCGFKKKNSDWRIAVPAVESFKKLDGFLVLH
jgi:hypothetical protein